MLTQRKSIFSPLSSPCLTSNRAVQSKVGPLNHFNVTLRFHSKVLLLTTDKRDVQSYIQEDEEQWWEERRTRRRGKDRGRGWVRLHCRSKRWWWTDCQRRWSHRSLLTTVTWGVNSNMYISGVLQEDHHVESQGNSSRRRRHESLLLPLHDLEMNWSRIRKEKRREREEREETRKGREGAGLVASVTASLFFFRFSQVFRGLTAARAPSRVSLFDSLSLQIKRKPKKSL